MTPRENPLVPSAIITAVDAGSSPGNGIAALAELLLQLANERRQRDAAASAGRRLTEQEAEVRVSEWLGAEGGAA